MQGTLQRAGDKWFILYSDNENLIKLDVKTNRINDLASVGVFLNDGDVVEFNIIEISDFPYRLAVPVVNNIENNSLITATTINNVTIRTKTQKRFELFFSGFDEITKKTIVCDGYDNSSNGYWYFFNRDENNNRNYVFASPISKTIFNSIEEVETQY